MGAVLALQYARYQVVHHGPKCKGRLSIDIDTETFLTFADSGPHYDRPGGTVRTCC